MSKDTLIQVARKDLGLEEIPRGSNRAPRIQEVLARCGLFGAYPWCCAIVVTWLADAYGQAVLPLSADCDVVYAYARLKRIVFKEPEVGDVFLRVRNGDATHAGIVVSVNRKTKSFTTIEGNSNDDGSREGYKCLALTRSYAEGKFVFVRHSLLSVENVLPTVSTEKQVGKILVDGHPFAKFKFDGEFKVPLRAFLAQVQGCSMDKVSGITFLGKKASIVTTEGAIHQLSSFEIVDSVGWVLLSELCSIINRPIVFDNETKVAKV